MNEHTGSNTPPPIRGSWEDLYGQAQRKQADSPEEAIPLYYRVFNGLGRLPKSKRLAADGRLQSLYERSALSLQAAFNLTERYDEAVDVLTQIRDNADREDKFFWHALIVDVLLIDNRLDEAHTRLRQLQGDLQTKGIGDWGPLAVAYVDAGQKQEATSVIDEAQRMVDEKYNSETDNATQSAEETEEEAEARRMDLAHVAWMRGILAIASQEWEDALAWFDQMIELEGWHADHLHHAYSRFIACGRHAEAEQLIKMDIEYPIRAGFWKGLVESIQGHGQSATHAWKHVSNLNVNEEPMSLTEYVLAKYYLGDPDDSGIDMVIYLLEEMSAAPWMLYYLAGISWAMNEDLTTAHGYLRIARDMNKSMAQGKLLPYRYWLMAKGLLDPPAAEELRGIFGPSPQPLRAAQ